MSTPVTPNPGTETKIEMTETADALDTLLAAELKTKGADAPTGPADSGPTGLSDAPTGPADSGPTGPSDAPTGPADTGPTGPSDAPTGPTGSAPLPKSDEFDTITLPPYSKPNTAESFARVKEMARNRIADLEQSMEAEKQARLKAEEAAKNVGQLSPEIEKELADLREFRQKMDVEADPTWTEFDSTIKSNTESIYSRLKEAGVADEVIKKIQDLGGPTQIEWDSVAAKLPSTLKRYIDGKVFEIESLQDKKKLAIQQAKENAQEFIKTRQAEIQEQSGANVKAVEREVNALIPQMGWLAEKPVPATATAEDKAALEAHNKAVQEASKLMKETIADDSPTNRALLVVGFAQLMKVRADFESAKKQHATALATKDAEIARLAKDLTEKTGMLERIKKNSAGRIISGGVPIPGATTTPTSVLKVKTGDHLDTLRQQIEAEKAAKA